MNAMPVQEFNFDGLVGPTHNYAGLARGNLASQENCHLHSHPRQAALQGLDKMKFLADLGIPQAVLPPQPRPDIPTLRRLGFRGADTLVLERAARDAPHLLAACCSASSMWAANAATVAPSPDTADHLLHLTPANLASHLHRALEAPATAATLRAIFPGPLFAHHEPLPATSATTDEGAANHVRLARGHGDSGLELFVYGGDFSAPSRTPHIAPRQARGASEAIARLHQLFPERTFFARQNPAAIDAGVFHNDVICVAHRHILLCHEHAFADSVQLLDALCRAFHKLAGTALVVIRIPDALLPLADAVRSYFFNSQFVTLPDDTLAFLAPTECRALPAAAAAIDLLRAQIPGIAVHFIDVRESMRNGGGPACLRLRVVLTPAQQAALHPGVRLTPTLYASLRAWIERHYRETLAPADLADPQLLAESRRALAELRTLGLPS